MNLIRSFPFIAAVAALVAGVFSIKAESAVPELTRGQTLTIPFPEMPATFAELLDPKGIQPMMTIFLPRNYDRQRAHPLLIFLNGGGGSRGQNPIVARKLTGEMDFVCVDLPLFKARLDPPAPGNGTSRLILQADDCKFMWSLHKTMLARLEAVVPNLDAATRILGGFSNGAHATAGLIDQSDGEVARKFSAFFFGEGGGRLERYDLLQGKRFLMLYGSEQSGRRAKEIHAAAVAAGARATLHEMKNVGHAFPESQYPVVTAWLRSEPVPAAVAGAAGDAKAVKVKEAAQTKRGTVKNVDTGRQQLTVVVARELTFSVADSTVITRGGAPARFAEFKIGDTVEVEYTRDGDTRTARRIGIQGPKSPTFRAPPAAGSALAPGDSQITVAAGGQTRTCVLHAPPSREEGKLLPVVIAFHGSGGTGRGMAGMTGFSSLADKHGFMAAYPDAIIGKGLWNSMFGRLPGGEGVLSDDVDDVAFVRALIETLVKSHHADPNRVFACGHSAGANLTYRLAVELSDRIAAVGIVNGSLGIKSQDGQPVPVAIPRPAAPISVLHVCGRQDNAVKFAGAQTPKNLYKSVPDCVRFFAEANSCAIPGTETYSAEHGLARTRHGGGKAGTEVELIVVENCGHNWPGLAQGLSASEALWEFFAKHPKNAN